MNGNMLFDHIFGTVSWQCWSHQFNQDEFDVEFQSVWLQVLHCSFCDASLRVTNPVVVADSVLPLSLSRLDPYTSDTFLHDLSLQSMANVRRQVHDELRRVSSIPLICIGSVA